MLGAVILNQKLGDSQAETIRKIQQAFGDDAMGVTQIKEWFNHFKDGHMLADSHQCSGIPSKSQNAGIDHGGPSFYPPGNC
jgi:hypothetical protein